MKVVSKIEWKSGFELLNSPPEHQSTAIIAIKDLEKGNFFILPEIFKFDEYKKGFVGEEHGMPINLDYWYMMEEDLLSPFNSMLPRSQDFANETASFDYSMLNA